MDLLPIPFWNQSLSSFSRVSLTRGSDCDANRFQGRCAMSHRPFWQEKAKRNLFCCAHDSPFSELLRTIQSTRPEGRLSITESFWIAVIWASSFRDCPRVIKSIRPEGRRSAPPFWLSLHKTTDTAGENKKPSLSAESEGNGKGGFAQGETPAVTMCDTSKRFDCLSRGAPVYPPWLVQTIRLTGGFELSIRPGCFCR